MPFPDQSVGDQNTLSDALVGFVTYATLISDSITFSDALIAVGRVAPTTIQFEDQLFFSDNVIITTVIPGILLGDSLSFTDRLSTNRTQSNGIADAVSLSDALGVTLLSSMGFSDTLVLSDASVATPNSIFLPLSLLTTDALSFSDGLAFVLSKSSIAFGDKYCLSDGILVDFPTLLNPYLRRYLNDVP